MGIVTQYLTCSYCGEQFPDTAPLCPHCARPALYVNVSRAENATERGKLLERYQRALAKARAKGCVGVLLDFERAVAVSKAVLVRKSHVLQALADSPNQILGTFYKDCLAGRHIPEGSEWDSLREFADTRLFGKEKQEIHFAALTLDDFGAEAYGEVHLHLREDRVAHRASVFHTNSALFQERYSGIMPSTGMPAGYRAPWGERHLVCVAKLADRVQAGTQPSEYGSILLSPHSDPRSEEFVEVHVWGPITIKTVERVAVRKRNLGWLRTKTERRKIEAELRNHGVELKVI